METDDDFKTTEFEPIEFTGSAYGVRSAKKNEAPRIMLEKVVFWVAIGIFLVWAWFYLVPDMITCGCELINLIF